MQQPERKGKHLTWEERDVIRKGLKGGLPFFEIANRIGRDSTTIAKEVKRHRYKKEVKQFSWVNDCAKQEKCRKRDICNKPKRHRCHISCKNCMSCKKHCTDYVQASCPIENKPPYVCNGCSKQAHCMFDKFYYGPDSAQKEYRTNLTQARQGINMTRDELHSLDNLISPLILKGQPIAHIYATHREEISVCERTLYRYVDAQYLSVRNLDMRRTVRYKPRKKKISPMPTKRKEGHRYSDFQEWINNHSEQQIVELDTVEGTKGGKLLLTMLFRGTNLMLAFLIPNKEMKTVIEIIDGLEEQLGITAFQKLFQVMLTDNGCEFADPEQFEFSKSGEKRTHIYYCDPRMSNQKGALEKNHEYIRYVLPKGTSFDNLTEETVLRIENHINNTARPGLGSKTPMSLALQVFDTQVLKSLGLVTIPADEVCLTKALTRK